EGDAAKVNWAPAGGLGGNTVTSLLAATGGANNKEHIFAANNTHEIFMQLDSAAPVNAWDVTLADAAGNAFNHGGAATTIHDLYLNHDGSALVFSKTNLHGYDTIAKANWNAAGHAASNVGAISIGGRAGQPVWTNANEPANIVFTAVDKAVFNIALNVGSATNLTPAAAVNVAVVLNPVPTAIYKLAKDGTKVEVFTKEGLFSVDGPNATVASPFTGDNYMDEGKKPADLESMKKADLKAADLGTKDIKDMAMSKTTTYYVTDKGLSVGKEATLKLNKRKKA
ncbi:MAG TPA: hypothetical protein VEK06_01930, partial [Myxococcota bacterium]|nr:hypothetical protein [Myxococcota bacterium]